MKSYALDLNNPGADKSDLYGRDSDTILCESSKQCSKLSLTNQLVQQDLTDVQRCH